MLIAAGTKRYTGCDTDTTLDTRVRGNNFGKRINASRDGVQFYREGDAFPDDGVVTKEDFEDLREGAKAESLI